MEDKFFFSLNVLPSENKDYYYYYYYYYYYSIGCPCSSWLFRFSILHFNKTAIQLYFKYKTVLIPKLKIFFII